MTTRLAVQIAAAVEAYDDAGRLTDSRPAAPVTLAALSPVAFLAAWAEFGEQLAALFDRPPTIEGNGS